MNKTYEEKDQIELELIMYQVLTNTSKDLKYQSTSVEDHDA